MAQVTVEVKTTVETVNLRLSLEEAQALKAVVGAVGGDAATSRRKLISKIFWALDAKGINSGSSSKYPKDLTGILTFQTESK